MRIMQQTSHSLRQARRRTLSPVTLLAIASLFIWLAWAWPVQAQTPTPSPRDALIQAIQQRAQGDVDMGKPLESVGRKATGLKTI